MARIVGGGAFQPQPGMIWAANGGMSRIHHGVQKGPNRQCDLSTTAGDESSKNAGRQSSRLALRTPPVVATACVRSSSNDGPAKVRKIDASRKCYGGPSFNAAGSSSPKESLGDVKVAGQGKRKRERTTEEAHPAASDSGQFASQAASMRRSGKPAKEHDKYCHFCQHVKVSMLACESGDCTHRFCTYCLSVHLGASTDPATSTAWQNGRWHCPTCRSDCCCSTADCDKKHRHCKAFRYRARRANAATMRNQAANALVALSAFSTPNGKKVDVKLEPSAAESVRAHTTNDSTSESAKEGSEPPPDNSRRADSEEERQLSPACSIEGPQSASEQSSCAGDPPKEDEWDSERDVHQAGSVYSLLNAMESDRGTSNGQLGNLLSTAYQHVSANGHVAEMNKPANDSNKGNELHAEELALIALASLSAMAEDTLKKGKSASPTHKRHEQEGGSWGCLPSMEPTCPASINSSAPSTPPGGESLESPLSTTS